MQQSNFRVITAILIVLGIIAGSLVMRSAYIYKFRQQETVSVTGAAEHNFVADLIVWSGTYSKNAMDLREAYAALKQDEQKVRSYLQSKGVSPNDVVTSAVNTEKQFAYQHDENGRQIGSTFAGYRLQQTVKVQSKEIEKVEKISREITELIENGVELTSAEPQYFYTKLSELKIDLLAKASADGKIRAETIAKNASNKLGALKKAQMGIFQIIGQNTNEDYSYGGAFNTSSKNKTATITIKMEFAAD